MTIIEEGYRSFDLEGDTHDVDEKNHRVVVHFPFERMDSYRSDFAKGWCDDYLAHNRPVMVVHHNPRDFIGRLVPDGYQNLGNRAELVGGFSDFDSVPLAREYFAHIRDDEIPGWSYHYRNGRGIAHPSGQRAAVRYTKADMVEFGPTPFPSIPGAGAVGLRSEELTLSIPTITEILAMKHDGVISDEGVRSLIETHYPDMREHIVVLGSTSIVDAVPKAQRALEDLAASFEETGGFRAMTITVGDDVSTSDGTVTDDGSDDAETLVKAIDATLDHAAAAIGDMDVTTLPDNVQQAVALMEAAGVAVDELQDVLGIDDPDDPLEGQRSEAEMDEEEGNRAVVSGAARDELPDSAFAYIEDGGAKDDDGKTTPRKLRHFPVQDADHVRNALTRIGQDAKFSSEAKPKVLAAAKKLGVEVAEGTRSDEGETTSTQAEAAAAALARLR